MKYPIGVQSFEKIRKGGFVYVDKTSQVYSLAEQCQFVFLGRPRRFGKSLLLSTIEAYFAGCKELFNGLAMESLEKEWKRHPILHFDLNTGDYVNNGVDELYNVLNYQLRNYEELYGGIDDTLSNRFLYLIKSAYEKTGMGVVILIDEYDKPILSNLNSQDIQEAIRSMLKSLFGCMKTADRYIRFAMLTGVSKFGQLSVFSDLNNIEDISLNKKYATLCGITEDELLETFSAQIDAFAKEYSLSRALMIEELRKKYDGYRFSKAMKLVYNPFSLLCAIKDKELKDYWFASGTPYFLVKLLQENKYDLSKIEGVEIDEDFMYKVDNISAIPILYQGGYLTIKDYNPETGLYTLDYPNQEVEAGFLNYLLPYYSKVTAYDSKSEMLKLINELKDGDIEAFMGNLQSIFYSIPYASDNSAKIQEDQFRNLTYLIFKLIGLNVQVECPMCQGRSDAIVKTHDHIYIFEFKIDSTAQKALAQILEKGYAKPFASDPRPKMLVGVNYSTSERAINEWVIE